MDLWSKVKRELGGMYHRTSVLRAEGLPLHIGCLLGYSNSLYPSDCMYTNLCHRWLRRRRLREHWWLLAEGDNAYLYEALKACNTIYVYFVDHHSSI